MMKVKVCIIPLKQPQLISEPIYLSNKPPSHNGKLHGTIASPRSRPLKGVDYSSEPILEDIRHVADCVSVREEIPPTGTVAVVVEPGAENEVGSDTEEEAVEVGRLVYAKETTKLGGEKHT